ncbi:MAG: hypothetical protein ACYCVD_18375 [Desulfitobacteriaceae bacterium]
MANCKYFIAMKLGDRVNCANCKRWNGERCRDEQLLRKQYEETQEFEFYDRMMRENKGIQGPL